jgi:hypothetical protein
MHSISSIRPHKELASEDMVTKEILGTTCSIRIARGTKNLRGNPMIFNEDYNCSILLYLLRSSKLFICDFR